MTNSRKLWTWLGAIFVVSFAILGLIGRDIYVQAPPVPDRVVTASGATVYTRDDFQNGREVWQTLGGMQLGSVWGHGGYVAPDWGADWLHREATTLLDIWAVEEGAKNFAAATFTAGASLPVLTALVMPTGMPMIVAVSIGSILFLGLLGAVGAKAGGAPIGKGIVRVVFWGALAMAITASIGKLVGTAV
jgi:nitric oxide reductase subunit B